MMNLELYHIVPELQPYVKVICSMEVDAPSACISSFRVLPDTCAELFVNYCGQPLALVAGESAFDSRRSFVAFRMSRYMDVQMQSYTGCVTVCFNPGMASAFFNLPMNDVSDTIANVDIFWNRLAAEMEERVAAADTNLQRVAIIQEYLVKRLDSQYEDDKMIRHCLWQINLLKGQLSVKELSRRSNIGERQLGRRFNYNIGLSPKEFTRINRFIHSLEQLRKYPSLSLTEIAYESGYYDQAHFIHDCHAYAGMAPGQLIAAQNILY